jgi:hypothetical protein
VSFSRLSTSRSSRTNGSSLLFKIWPGHKVIHAIVSARSSDAFKMQCVRNVMCSKCVPPNLQTTCVVARLHTIAQQAGILLWTEEMCAGAVSMIRRKLA